MPIIRLHSDSLNVTVYEKQKEAGSWTVWDKTFHNNPLVLMYFYYRL